MPWIKKIALCNWCHEEVNAIIDKVYEGDQGTLCARCEKGRLAEREIYKEDYEAKRIEQAIKRELKKLNEETSEE